MCVCVCVCVCVYQCSCVSACRCIYLCASGAVCGSCCCLIGTLEVTEFYSSLCFYCRKLPPEQLPFTRRMQYLPGSQSAEARLSFLTQNLYWKASASKLPARWNSLLLELLPCPECCQLPSENSLPGQPSEGDSSAYEPPGHSGLVVTVTDN